MPIDAIFFCIFMSVAIISTASLYMRQSLLFAYILAGILLSQYGFNIVADLALLEQLGEVGIIFLLFLLGLDLTPKEFLSSLQETSILTIIFSIMFTTIGFSISYLLGYTTTESLMIGICMIFSSTIISLKLLPSLALRYKQIGHIMISILLLQDILAIFTLLFISTSITGMWWADMVLIAVILPIFFGCMLLVQRYLLTPLLFKFEKIHEYIFIIALAWCLGLSQLANLLKISPEVGAFIAGVTIAEGTIANHIANNLKPLRDFCLVLFFFSIGARLNLTHITQTIWTASILAAIVLIVKPILFTKLLIKYGKQRYTAIEAGIRLGQTSEFSFLITNIAVAEQTINYQASSLIQIMTIITFMFSSYLITRRYPTPFSSDEIYSD